MARTPVPSDLTAAERRVFGGANAVEVSGLHKAFGSKVVLNGVALSVAEGEVLVIVGPSGSGKSTLLRCIARLVPITAGQIRVGTTVIQEGAVGWRRSRQIARRSRSLRGEVGMVFQHFNLFPHKTARQNVAMGLRLVRGVSRADADTAAVELLTRMGLTDHLEHHPGELSGGQQQRASLARALYNGRPVLIGDEPVSALDRVQGAEILSRIASRHGTIIVALHDIVLALGHTDRIVVLDSGRIVLDAPSRTLTAADLVAYYGG